MASREAAIVFFCTFFRFGRKYCSFKKELNSFAKIKTKSSSRPFWAHPAAGPETEVFFSLASNEQRILFKLSVIQNNLRLEELQPS